MEKLSSGAEAAGTATVATRHYYEPLDASDHLHHQ
jgi:hypothetical protein